MSQKKIACYNCLTYDADCQGCTNEVELWESVKRTKITKYQSGKRYLMHSIIGDYNAEWSCNGWPVLLDQTLLVFRVKVIDPCTWVMGLFVPKGLLDNNRVGPSVHIDIEQKNVEGTRICYETGVLVAKAGDSDIEAALGEGRAMLITEINIERPFMLKLSF